MDLPSSSSSSFSSTFVTGGRALDRHNPTITDEKRSGSSSKPGTPLGTPCTHNILQQKPKTPTPSPKPSRRKKTNNKPSILKIIDDNKSNNKIKNSPTKTPSYVDNNDDDDNNNDNDENHGYEGMRKSFSLCKPSDLIMKAAACNTSKPGVDYFSPPESSRYLLDDTSFLDVLSDFDPVPKLATVTKNSNHDSKHGELPKVLHQPSNLPPKVSSSPVGASDQVVVLRVSLHCRGCERKMKKHLSRMPGVTSFNIDFAAKKVTVMGDVTPLGVLASISKVKTAKLWAPPAISSSTQFNSRNIEVTK